MTDRRRENTGTSVDRAGVRDTADTRRGHRVHQLTVPHSQRRLYKPIDPIINVGSVRVGAWRSGNALCPNNVIALRRARLVLGWMSACVQVNHLGICNQPPRSTQRSIPPG